MAAKKFKRGTSFSRPVASPAKAVSPLATAIELKVARTNAKAMQILAAYIADHARSKPLEHYTVLVDNHSIGRNIVAHVAAETGMSVGMEPMLLRRLFRQITHGVRSIGSAPLPVPNQDILSHHMAALAILELAPALRKAGSKQIKEYASAIASAADVSTKMALASEMARSLDTALDTSLDFKTLEPWVEELRNSLAKHAAALSASGDRRLQDYLDGWPQIVDCLTRLAGDASLHEKVKRRGFLPPHVIAFDLTLYSDTPQSIAMNLLAQRIPVTFILVDPFVRNPKDPASRAWAMRSRRPLLGTYEALSAAPPVAPKMGGPPPAGMPSLSVMQDSVAGEPTPAGPAKKNDRSISVHHVVSAARASEIVRDVIHHTFLDINDLLPEQIAVVSDDPRRDAPFIENAFSMIEVKEESLPVTVTGINTRDRDKCVDAFLTALRLAPTSFARDAVFSLLANELVAQSLGLASDEVDELAKACSIAGLRAYVDETHRKDAIGVHDESDHCTWSAALASLAMSMALPDGGHEEVSVGGVVPAGSLQSTEMPQLAALQRIIELLQNLKKIAAGGRLSDMVKTAHDVVGVLFSRPKAWTSSRDAVQATLSAIEADAASAGFDGEVDYFWFVGEISRRLNRINSSTRVLHGGVSLLSPTQARGRTPRVTVFLLSEQFPTDDRPLWPNPFPAKHWGGAQRQHADLRDIFSVFMNTDERVVFVVPSMCDRTHEQLSMSSVVHDIRTISESLASTVTVIEHTESVIAHSVYAFDEAPNVYGRPLPTRHRGAIRGGIALAKTRTHGTVARPFGVKDLSLDVPTEITIEQFARFFEKPIESFFEYRRIFVKDVEDEWQLREAIDPNYLERWKVNDTIYRLAEDVRHQGGRFTSVETAKATALLRAAGMLRGDIAGQEYLDDRVPNALAIENFVAGAMKTHIDVTVDYTISGHKKTLRIVGDVPINAGCAVRYVLSSLRAKRILAAAAVQAVCHHAKAASEWEAVFISTGTAKKTTSADADVNFVRGHPSTGAGQPPLSLTALVRLWHLGHQMPLPLFAEAIKGSLPRRVGDPLDFHKALKTFHASDQGQGSSQGLEATVRAAFRGQEPITGSLTGGAISDFNALASFFSGQIPDPFPHI